MGDDARCDVHDLNRPFESSPSGSQEAAPSQVDGTSSYNARLQPCLSCLAASRHVHARRLVVAPWVCACPFVGAPRGVRVCACVTALLGCARPSVAAPQVVACPLRACLIAATSRHCTWLALRRCCLNRALTQRWQRIELSLTVSRGCLYFAPGLV